MIKKIIICRTYFVIFINISLKFDKNGTFYKICLMKYYKSEINKIILFSVNTMILICHCSNY